MAQEADRPETETLLKLAAEAQLMRRWIHCMLQIASSGKARKGYTPAQDGPSKALPEMAHPIISRIGFHNVWN